MTDLLHLLADFAAARVDTWTGLPAGTGLDTVAALHPDPQADGRARAGQPPIWRTWLACDSAVYQEGLRVWVDGDDVVLIEGNYPVGTHGELLHAPDLGPPDITLDTVLGRLVLAGGERIYAARGLALRVNPANEVLLGVRGFAPTSVSDYRGRLRPFIEPRRSLLGTR